MAINKLRLTFNFSANVAHTRVSSIYQNIVISETTRTIELQFNTNTSYDKIAKSNTNCSCHMAKMAATPPFKNLLFQKQKAEYLWTWYVPWGCLAYQVW